MKPLLATLLFVFSTSVMAQTPAVGGDGYQAWIVIKDDIYWCHWNHAYDALWGRDRPEFPFCKKAKILERPSD